MAFSPFRRLINYLSTPHKDAGKSVRRVKTLVFGAIVAPTLLLSVFSYINLNRQLSQYSFLRRQSIAYLASSTLRSKFDSATELGVVLAGSPQFHELIKKDKWKEAADTLQISFQDQEIFDNLAIIDRKGTIKGILIGTLPDIAISFENDDWYRAISRNWNPYVSDVRPGLIENNRREVFVAVPIQEGGSNVIGILVGSIGIERISEWGRSIDGGTKSDIIYADRQGRAIVMSVGKTDKVVSADLSAFGPIDMALRYYRGVEVTFDPTSGQEAVVAYEPVLRYGWASIVKQPVNIAFGITQSDSFFLLTVYILILVMNILVALLVVSALNAVTRLQTREKTVFESVGDGLVVVDRKARIVDLNPTAEEMFGWTRGDAKGRDFAEVLVAQDEKGRNISRDQRTIWQALSGNRSVAKYLYMKKDGTKFPASVTATPLLVDDNVAGAVMTYRDISKEEELDRAKKEFISVASHQLLTPVSAVKGFLSLLLDGDFGPITGKQREYLDKLFHLNERMIELVEDLLNVSRIDLGVFEAVVEPLDMKTFLKAEIEAIRPIAAAKGVHLEEEYDARDMALRISPKLLRNVVQNLMSNAIKYTPKGGRVSVRLAPSDDHDLGPSLLFSVKDTGYGIPDAAKNGVFRKFFRADNVRMMGAEGTGLGLYIVKSVINLFHGKIWFDSEEGKGTTFYAVFPLTASQSLEEHKSSEPKK